MKLGYRELLAHPDIDAAAVVLRVPSHYEPTMAALAADCNFAAHATARSSILASGERESASFCASSSLSE